MEKKTRLCGALSNGGMIQALFLLQIQAICESSAPMTFVEAYRKVKARLEYLCSEASALPPMQTEDDKLQPLSKKPRNDLRKIYQREGLNNASASSDPRRCSNCGKPGHSAEFCWNDIKCPNCGRLGHIAKVCRYGSNSADSSLHANEKSDAGEGKTNLAGEFRAGLKRMQSQEN
jgi:phage FluMu protein Com